MKRKKSNPEYTVVVIFRATKNIADKLNALARTAGITRSDVLRQLIERADALCK